MPEELTRRDFVRLTGGAAAFTVAGGLPLLLSACGGQPKAPAVVQSPSEDLGKLYEEAKKEGTLSWWTAHYEQKAAETMRDAFKAKYPGIEVQLIRQTAQELNRRLSQELSANLHTVDVWDSTVEEHYVEWKSKGVLQQYRPVGIDKIPNEFQKLETADDYWQLGALGFVLINYQTQKVSASEVPKKWKDLLDPKWKGKIQVGHPNFSGYVGNWVLAMNDKFGWQYFEDLKKNEPKIDRSVNSTVTAIQAGERQIGAGPDNFSLEKKSAGVPIDIQYPNDEVGAIVIVSPTGILKDAPHLNAARLFESFRYSPEYNAALVKTFNLPLRTDVASPPGGKPLKEVKFSRNSLARLKKINTEIVPKWRDTFGV